MIQSLHLDKPTSHGGWPSGHGGGWTDKTPVNVQIKNWLESMGLLDDSDHAVLSEQSIKNLIRNSLLSLYNYRK